MLPDTASDDSVSDAIVDAAEVDNQYHGDEHGSRRSIKHTPHVEHGHWPPLGVQKKTIQGATLQTLQPIDEALKLHSRPK